MKILLVEDDESMTSALLKGLSLHRYLVNATDNGQTGLDLVILLDVLLPGLDGLNLCRQLRAQGCQTPILMLSAKDKSCDRVMGLEAGADDYLVKPFELSEVIARIQALLRRGRETAPAVLNWGSLALDCQTQEVTCGGQLIHLTPKEYGLLELFLKNPHQLFTRSVILDHLWSLDKCPAEEAVNTHIKVLRQKLLTAGLATHPIKTVYGLGYRLAPAPLQSEVAQTVRRSPAHFSTLNREAEANVAASIAQVWNTFKVHWQDQLHLLQEISHQWTVHAVDPELLEQATAAAHRLAGSLGTFGRPLGTEIARRVETLLSSETEPNSVTALQLSTLVNQLQQAVEDPCPQTTLEPQPPGLTAQGKVMVVDDDPQILAILPEILEPLGLRVTTLANPQRFWEMLKSTTPNLLILDIEMPDFNGIDLCQMLRHNQHWSQIPVLFLTAHANPQFQNRAFTAGADDYIIKPIVPSELVTRVLNRLERVRSRLNAGSVLSTAALVGESMGTPD
jgi:DNA-binding response OmpR family regulator